MSKIGHCLFNDNYKKQVSHDAYFPFNMEYV